VPHFFFHLYNDAISCDEEGQDLPDRSAARQRALDYARDMAAVMVKEGNLDLAHRIEVTDQEGAVVETLFFRDAIHIKSDGGT
jgi:hypothetical protein